MEKPGRSLTGYSISGLSESGDPEKRKTGKGKMKDRIAIVGAGAMGTLLGAVLNKNGVPTDLVDVDRRHVEALNRNGARVTGTAEFSVPVRALAPEEMEGVYDILFLMIKQTYNEASFPQILPHLAEDGVIVTLQNGMPELAVAEVFGEERTMGCAVTWAATMRGPGVTEATAEPDAWHSSLGRLDGKITEKGKKVRSVLEKMCPVVLSDNLAGIRWAKMVVNCAFSGMSAALGCTFGGVIDSEDALACAQHIARECVRVSRACGVSMEALGPEGAFDRFADFATEEERRSQEDLWKDLFARTRGGKSSMLQDLEHGRRSEVHAINGVLCREGKARGIPTPFSDLAVELVERAEQAGTVPDMRNLSAFRPILEKNT